MEKRILIFTGKGGVGKTSIAAAHAVKAAKEGRRTLLVSTDMAHNLSDLFGVNLGTLPYEISENLEAYEIDANYVLENDFQNITSCLTNMLPESQKTSADELGIMPGMEELFSLLKIEQLFETGKYDLIVVDCAPTGETLSLLKFPELLSWYMEKLFPIGKLAMRVLSPISKHAFKVELPNRQAMNDIERLYEKLVGLQELFKNRETTSVRIVTVPEKMVVEETKRNYMYMNLYNYNVDGIYINRVLPEQLNNPFFEQWISIQKEYCQEIKESFVGVPIYHVPWYDEEIDHMDAIERIVTDALVDEKIFEVKEVSKREKYEKTDQGYTLQVPLPCLKKEDLDLYQSSNELVIRVENQKRNISLPNILREYEVAKADLSDGVLTVWFERGE